MKSETFGKIVITLIVICLGYYLFMFGRYVFVLKMCCDMNGDEIIGLLILFLGLNAYLHWMIHKVFFSKDK